MLKMSELFAAVSPRTQAEKELVDIKDLSLDEIMVCVRELTSELDAIPLDLSQQLSLEQLRDELMALEFQRFSQRDGGKSVAVNFLAAESRTRLSQ